MPALTIGNKVKVSTELRSRFNQTGTIIEKTETDKTSPVLRVQFSDGKSENFLISEIRRIKC